MTSLALAALTFTALHLLVSGTKLRDVLVAQLGEQGFRGLFSAASALSLAWLVWAYIGAHVPRVTPWPHLRGIADLLVLVAFVFVVLGLMTPSPTLVGGEKLLDRPEGARGIQRVTRHPFLWGISLWAVVHAVFNPDAANLLFFGTFAVVGIAGTFSIDAKRARMFGERWSRYAAVTSNIPFAAIVQGRNRLAAGEIGIGKVVVALAVFALAAYFHARLFGLPPF